MDTDTDGMIWWSVLWLIVGRSVLLELCEFTSPSPLIVCNLMWALLRLVISHVVVCSVDFGEGVVVGITEEGEEATEVLVFAWLSGWILLTLSQAPVTILSLPFPTNNVEIWGLYEIKFGDVESPWFGLQTGSAISCWKWLESPLTLAQPLSVSPVCLLISGTEDLLPEDVLSLVKVMPRCPPEVAIWE